MNKAIEGLNLEKTFAEEVKTKQPLKGTVIKIGKDSVVVQTHKNGFYYYIKILKKDVKENTNDIDMETLFAEGEIVLFQIKEIAKLNDETEEVFGTTKTYYNILVANQMMRGKDYTKDVQTEKMLNDVKDKIKSTLGTISKEASIRIEGMVNDMGIMAFVNLLTEELSRTDKDPSITLLNNIEKAAKERGCL